MTSPWAFRRSSCLLATLFVALAATRAAAGPVAARFDVPPISGAYPGRTITVPVTVTNTGAATWGEPGACVGSEGLYFVTYHLVDGRTGTVVARNVRPTFLAQSVRAGESVRVPVHVDVPVAPGDWKLRFSMGGPKFPSRDEYPEPPSSVDKNPDAPLSIEGNIALLDEYVKHLPIYPKGPDEVTPFGIYVLETPFHFGSTEGTVTLKGAFNFGSYPMQIINWNDSIILFHVPTICSEMDQDAELEIVTASGKKSSASTRFIARVEERRLTQDDMTVSCSNEATDNECNSGDFTAHKNWAVTGHHRSLGFNDAGKDVFTVPLINGWQISRVNVVPEGRDPDLEWVFVFDGSLTFSSTANSVEVKWELGLPFTAKDYVGIVDVSGPCGFAYR